MKIAGTDFEIAGEKANPKQVEFMCRALSPDAYRYFAYGGAIRGGKSYVVLFILHQLSLKHPGSKWIVVREDLPALKTTTIPSFKKLIHCEKYGTWNNSTPITFKYRNGSEIIFKPQSAPTDPDLNSFLGLECSGFFLEQLEELKEKMWDMAIQRAGSLYIKDTPPAYVFTTFNPTQGWVKDKFYEPWVKGQLKSPYFFQPALPKDNPFVTSDQWSAWGNMADRYKLQFIDGDWSNFEDSSNRWAFAYDPARHTGEPEWNPKELTFLSFDFNVNPMCCSVIQHYGRTIRVLETIKLPNSGTEQMCEVLLTRYPKATFIVTGDASGSKRDASQIDNVHNYTIIQRKLKLADKQFKVPTTNPGIKVNKVLVNSILQNYGFIAHRTKAKALHFDLGNVRVLADGSMLKKDRTDPTQQADALDTLRYFCNTFMGNFLEQ